MMDFNERVIPGITANFHLKESLARYKFANKHIKKTDKVLDIGCGTGYGSATLKGEVTAIDNNQEAVRYAKKNYGDKARFVKASATELPLEDKHFDVVCSFEVIEHIEDDKKYLQEANRVLKTKGILILSTPNKNRPSLSKSPYHVREYTQRKLLSLLKKHFRTAEIWGQSKSKKAQAAFKDFMDSQLAREYLVKRDFLGIRRLLTPEVKERIWRYFGDYYGRGTQKQLDTNDFPIRKANTEKAEYFLAICKK